MAVEFELLSESLHVIRPYFGFDLSKFRVTCRGATSFADSLIIGAFFADPISSKEFINPPDRWGTKGNSHGPMWRTQFIPSFCHCISADELARAVDEAVRNPYQSSSEEKLEPLRRWVESTRIAGDACYAIRPVLKSMHEDENAIPNVWSVWAEFITLSPDRSVLTIAVISED